MGVETVLFVAGLWTVIVLFAISLAAAAKRGDRHDMAPEVTPTTPPDAEPESELPALGAVTAARF